MPTFCTDAHFQKRNEVRILADLLQADGFSFAENNFQQGLFSFLDPMLQQRTQ